MAADAAHLQGMNGNGQADAWAILLAGEVWPGERLRRQLRGTRVVAADGGLAHAEALGVAPELVIGDFDSVSPHLLARHEHLPRQTHPVAKDMTDGQLAIRHVLGHRVGLPWQVLVAREQMGGDGIEIADDQFRRHPQRFGMGQPAIGGHHARAPQLPPQALAWPHFARQQNRPGIRLSVSVHAL